MGVNTIFSKGERIHSPALGYITLENGHAGADAITGKAHDASNRKSLFVKKFNNPTSLNDWFWNYKEYLIKVKYRLEACRIQICPTFYDIFIDDAGWLWTITELIEPSKTLRELLTDNSLAWEDRKAIAIKLTSALSECHRQGIVHSDLKPENILLQRQFSGKIKLWLIDFDRSVLADCSIPWQKDDGFTGTPNYYSPEHLLGKKPVFASDTFTCGLILYELLTLNGHPYINRKNKSYPRNPLVAILRCQDGSIDGIVADVLTSTLLPEVSQRPRMDMLNQLLAENWNMRI